MYIYFSGTKSSYKVRPTHVSDNRGCMLHGPYELRLHYSSEMDGAFECMSTWVLVC